MKLLQSILASQQQMIKEEEQNVFHVRQSKLDLQRLSKIVADKRFPRKLDVVLQGDEETGIGAFRLPVVYVLEEKSINNDELDYHTLTFKYTMQSASYDKLNKHTNELEALLGGNDDDSVEEELDLWSYNAVGEFTVTVELSAGFDNYDSVFTDFE